MFHNNFDFIRLVAAFSVLFGHSFIFLGKDEPLFANYTTYGPLGVTIFFAISGFLINESWSRDPSAARFLIRRGLRIFPGLVVCVVLSVIVLGPLLTTLPLNEYFESHFTKTYFWNILLYPIYYLPGVFEHNRVPNAVNGSLWSLPAEVLMYLLLCLSGTLRLRRILIVVFAIASASLSYFWVWRSTEMAVFYGTDLRQVAVVGVYFWVGAAFSIFNVRKWFSLSGIIIAAVIFSLLSIRPDIARLASWLLVPYIVLSFGVMRNSLTELLTKLGDCSYGIYIYAFPIQQTVVYFWPNMPFELYLLLCSILTLVAAISSWRFVEKKALSLKPAARRQELKFSKTDASISVAKATLHNS